ncbi:MAG: (2Fe-2S)-binding protein [Nitrospina sp.]|jgi:ferredoxin|nr:(2Fe-2S)-binding protein [Nitrospina sp.]MBT3508878.1 (2Fe-2S)-binding protein [Nitrospina sp.]MBT3874646.1 (2Fe-2S)-binding protein [Nitrospina sp.]MBT4047742.1 (2Fe-2S)-binding protein [Nitrospina sp.]MBT4556700.1 (2Fe-2S)-binding protein [Nitrospina sp.]
MLKVHFEKENRTIQVEPGENLRQAAIRNKFSVYANIHKILNCRGRGLCTACTVQVIAGKVEPRNETETEKLAKKPADFRLACQVTVNDDLVVKTHP